MKVSVIIPVYNNEKYIERCVKSVLEQTYQDIELIIVDDGSSDSSGKICDNLAQIDLRIKVIHQDNGGVSKARNVGLENATGQLVSFIDSDDWIESDLYSRAVSEFDKDIDIVAFCGRKKYQNKDDKGYSTIKKAESISNIEAINRMNYSQNLVAGVCLFIYRREIIGNNRFPRDVIIGEDYAFNINVLLGAKRVYLLPYCGYNYFQRSDSVSYRGYQGKSDKIMYSYQAMKNLQINKDKRLCRSAISYYVLQVMAIVISMVKADVYDRSMIVLVQNEVRKNLKSYIFDTKNKFYHRCCAVLISIHYKALIIPYKIIFDKHRQA